MFFTVAYNCRSKRNNRYVHGQKKRLTEKMKDLAAKRKRLTAKEKTSQSPTLSFMPRKHCYFFCREVISLAVSLLLLICREGYSFCCEVFSLAVRLFLLAVRFFILPWVFFFAEKLFLLPWQLWATVVFFDWFRILNSPPWPIRRRI